MQLHLPPPPRNYRHMRLYTRLNAFAYLRSKALIHNYVLINSANNHGFSNMLNDIATLNIPLIDNRPERFHKEPFLDHFMGPSKTYITYISPTLPTIQYFADYAFAHGIRPIHNLRHLTAWASIVFHLMGLGWITPSLWPTNTRRHRSTSPNDSLDDTFHHTTKIKSPSASL